jgi:hypothetical protein
MCSSPTRRWKPFSGPKANVGALVRRSGPQLVRSRSDSRVQPIPDAVHIRDSNQCMTRHRILPVRDVSKVCLTQCVSKDCPILVNLLGSAFVVDLALAIAGGAPGMRTGSRCTDRHCSRQPRQQTSTGEPAATPTQRGDPAADYYADAAAKSASQVEPTVAIRAGAMGVSSVTYSSRFSRRLVVERFWLPMMSAVLSVSRIFRACAAPSWLPVPSCRGGVVDGDRFLVFFGVRSWCR